MKKLLFTSLMICSFVCNAQKVLNTENLTASDTARKVGTFKLQTGDNWVTTNDVGNFHFMKPMPFNMKVFDKQNKLVAYMDSTHILTVYDSLATIKAFINGYGIEIKGYAPPKK